MKYGLLALGLLLVACQSDAGYWNKLGSYPSPDGQHVAELFAVAYGGATVGYTYEVLISPVSNQGYRQDDSVWQAYKLAPRSVEWVSPKQVSVVLASGARESSYKTMIRESRDGEFTSITEFKSILQNSW